MNLRKLLYLLLFPCLLLISSCEEDEGTAPTPAVSLPVTIDLGPVQVTRGTTSFTVDNFEFTGFDILSEPSEPGRGLLLNPAAGQTADPPAFLALDLTSNSDIKSSDIKSITLFYDNWCNTGCVYVVQTLDAAGNVLRELNDDVTVPRGPNQEITLNNISASIATLKITSGEFTVRTITLR